MTASLPAHYECRYELGSYCRDRRFHRARRGALRAQVVTREMPMPPLGESLPPTAAAAATTATATASTPATAAVDDRTEARQHRAAASNHDAATLVDLFAEDGVLVASDHDVIRGRQDIGKYLANAGDQGMPEVTLTCVSAESQTVSIGDWPLQRARHELRRSRHARHRGVRDDLPARRSRPLARRD